MSFLKRTLDNIRPHVMPGGKHEKWYAFFEAIDTLFYSPEDVNKGRTHVRDSIDLKRVMIFVWIAAMPCVLFGSYNVGLQANEALQALSLTEIQGWRGELLRFFGLGVNPDSLLDNFFHGCLLYTSPSPRDRG